MKFKDLLKVIRQDETIVICYKNEDTYAKQTDVFDVELLESVVKYIHSDHDFNLNIVMENYKE